jgi:5-methyltetrahydropteroyltriglutamate--homocysteine methyltransferase
MTAIPTKPFRADHVGSLLRPQALRDARAKAARGEISKEAARDIQQAAIREIVAKQESIGLQSVTDGEFSRDWWHVDFLAGFAGVETYYGPASSGFGGVSEQPALLKVTGKIRRTKPIFVEHFKFLKSVTNRTPKMTIPAPAMLHHRAGRAAVSMEAYPDIEEMWSDVSKGYAEEIAELGREGCTYLQIDDTSHAMLCDAKFREGIRNRGDDPEKLVHTYGNAINRALANRPAGMTVTMHTCRGNFMSAWVAAGGYEPVAEAVFSGINVDAFFLEFDSERAGGFEPLRFVPKNKKIVLGLITTKTPELESKDAIKRRIDEAAKYVPLENLCLSPQCGFSSTHHGNKITTDVQWRKLQLVVDVAREVWGG